jgi:hypothetical protein
VGALDGGAAALFGELLSPIYLPATLRRFDNSYDEKGTLQRGGGPRSCRVQVDRATERMADTEGYTSTDRAIYVLAASLEGDEPVDTNHEIEVLSGKYAGAVYRLAAPIDRDPACAYWLCRGVEQKAAA